METVRAHLPSVKAVNTQSALAASLLAQSHRELSAGHFDAATALAMEAVGQYVELTMISPRIFNEDTVKAFRHLSSCHSGSGDLLAAVNTVDAAIYACRSMANQDWPNGAAHRATFTSERAGLLRALGKLADAADAATEAVSLAREVVVARPGLFQAQLATFLSEQAKCLSALGRADDAIAAGGEALIIRRSMANEGTGGPEGTAVPMAMALVDLTSLLGKAGRAPEAARVSEEAVALFRAQMAKDPPFGAALSFALVNQAKVLEALAQVDDALGALAEAISLFEPRAEANPTFYRPHLARALDDQSRLLAQLGRPEEALGSITKSVIIRRQLVSASPETFTVELCRALFNQCCRLEDVGQLSEASVALDEGLGIARQHAGALPMAARDAAMHLIKRAEIAERLAQPEQALTAIDEAIGILRPLAHEQQVGAGFHLVIALNNKIGLLGRLGRREEARAVLEEANAVYTCLSPNGVPCSPELAKLSDALARQGESLTEGTF
jgi:tetratricopeptide (TPR) repeat protein